ncbi:MAG: NAD-dependent epimerase/dehydratase family protein [Bacteroidia bacterium]|nr:NAD-dependent epimerase/dehydratase family protein [Bacteroidia bacterium]
MKTLVTGASGFIGQSLTRRLLQQGDELRLFCRSSSDMSTFGHSHAEIVRGELTSEADLTRALIGCDRVYHLAAFAGNWSSQPDRLRAENRAALQALCTAARKASIRRLLYTSTVMVYGPSNGHAVSEQTPRATPPATLYEQLKVDALDVVDEAVAQGLDAVVIHPTRVFGPGPLTEANSTTILIDQYRRGTWRMLPGEGHAAGNYVYVEDVVEGMIRAMERGATGRHYIIGGCNLTFNEFFALLAECSGQQRLLVHVPKSVATAAAVLQERMGRRGWMTPVITPAWVDVFYDNWLCTSRRAAEELGYQPTPMRAALRSTLAWLRTDRREGGAAS